MRILVHEELVTAETSTSFTYRNDESTSVLVLSGTHGEGGVTGLTERNKLDRSFYESDCKGKNLKVLVDLIFHTITMYRCWSCSEAKILWNIGHYGDTESWTIWGPGLLLQWSRHRSDEDSGWKIETWRMFLYQNIIIIIRLLISDLTTGTRRNWLTISTR